MTKLTVNLNTLASKLCGENPKVRVRIASIDGVSTLQIRPTDRKIPKGLPAGEILADLKTRADRGTKKFTLPETLNLDGILAVGGKLMVGTLIKHNWLTLTTVDAIPSEIGKAAPAGASVTDK